ncbi:CheY-like chemotaxis protein [Xanthomonas sp. 60]
MQTTPPVPRPRILLVEDDIITSRFLKAALEGLPADVEVADTASAAQACAEAAVHDLWLIDANLPDGHGIDLLSALRARRPGTPAVAHTADANGTLHGQLRQAGFADTLIKPISRAALLDVVRRALASRPAAARADAGFDVAVDLQADPEDWDETSALAALNGQHKHLIALRELFLAELPGVRDAVDQAVVRHDEPALRSQLHRLQASCGFVGAARLARAVRQLHQMPASNQAHAGFQDAVASLLH